MGVEILVDMTQGFIIDKGAQQFEKAAAESGLGRVMAYRSRNGVTTRA